MKRVPLSEEKEYLRLDRAIKELQAEQSRLKKRFATYYKKGLSFSLLTATVCEVFSPPWKLLCLELLARFMTLTQRKAWMRSIKKRFPRHEIAPSFKASKYVKERVR